MRKYIVLGVNESPKYLYYLPLVIWAWKKFGWETLVFYHAYYMYAARLQTPIEQLVFKVSDRVFALQNISGYKSETLAQVSRLYACCVEREPNSLLMTSDCDMLPLSNYWHPSDLNVTCYGRDLTDYHYPICYVAMTSRKWHEVMLITDSECHKCILQDLEERPINSNPWLWDQDILTERLNHYGKKFLNLVPRGTDPRTGYPVGRVDRSNWRLDHKQLIDAHLPHDILTNDASFRKVMELLHHVWPKEDWKWFAEYHKEFKKLL